MPAETASLFFALGRPKDGLQDGEDTLVNPAFGDVDFLDADNAFAVLGRDTDHIAGPHIGEVAEVLILAPAVLSVFTLELHADDHFQNFLSDYWIVYGLSMDCLRIGFGEARRPCVHKRLAERGVLLTAIVPHTVVMPHSVLLSEKCELSCRCCVQ